MNHSNNYNYLQLIILMPPKKDPKVEEQAKEPEPEPQPHELNGFGRFEYLSGALYQGNWTIIATKKVKHGYGKLTIPNPPNLPAESYEGDWHEDQMQGFGTYHYPDGSIYHGEWLANQHHGQGVFQFPNGTVYKGEWKGHLMNGKGEFTDHLGRTWIGQYREGIFDSRSQNNLSSIITVGTKDQELQKAVDKSLDNLLALLQPENQQQVFRIAPFFSRNKLTDRLVKSPQIKFEQKTSEQWITFLKKMKEGRKTVLREPKESKVLLSDDILCHQQQGPGQIVEVHCDDGHCSAFLNVETDNWILVGLKQS